MSVNLNVINTYTKENPLVVRVDNSKSKIYDDNISAVYSCTNATRIIDLAKEEKKEYNEINISSYPSTVCYDNMRGIENIFSYNLNLAVLNVRTNGISYIPSTNLHFDCNLNSINTNVHSNKIDNITSSNETLETLVKHNISLSRNLMNFTIKKCKEKLVVNDLKDRISHCDFIYADVWSIVSSNDVFYNNNRDSLTYDIQETKSNIGCNIVEFESAYLNVDTKELDKSNVLRKCISMNVEGTSIRPNPDADIPDIDEGLSGGVGLSSLNIKVQKNNYFEIKMILGKEIKRAEKLPKGVIFDGYKVRGSIANHGKYHSILYLENEKIEIVFEVDALLRTL